MAIAELDRSWGYVARALALRFTADRASRYGEGSVIEGTLRDVEVRIDVVPEPETPATPSTRLLAIAPDVHLSFSFTLAQFSRLEAEPTAEVGSLAALGHGVFDARFRTRMRTTSVPFTRAILRGPLTDALLAWSHFGFALHGSHATATGAGVILDPDALATVLHIVVALAKAPGRIYAQWSQLADQLGGQFAHFDISPPEDATLPPIELHRHGARILVEATDEPSEVVVTRLTGTDPALRQAASSPPLRVVANLSSIENAIETVVVTSNRSPYRG